MSLEETRVTAQAARPPESVHEMVRRMFRGQQATPLPPNESWSQMIERTGADHWAHEIDEQTFDWYLECLPPKFQGRGWFAFAEGAEPLRLFVRDRDRYLTRRLTWEDTDLFCRLANINLPS